MINIILIDDQILFRESLQLLLENDENINVIATGKNGEEAIELCEKHNPDIILLDIGMPDVNGVEAAQRIKQNNPNIKIIMLTTFEDEDSIMKSFVYNIDSYIVKNISHHDLIRTIKCVNNELLVIDKNVKEIFVKKFTHLTQKHDFLVENLSDRDKEIIKLISQGMTNKEIAYELSLSIGTIKNNISKILETLNLQDRLQIAIFAIENGMT